jgi:SAM-dependent methyltransferase
MPRAPGRIFADGDRELAEALVAALRAPELDHDIAETLTHPFHTYPARMHPASARVLVDVVGSAAQRDVQKAPGMSDRPTILDPFCGSGTALVEARVEGFRAVGVDLNPLAVLVARAKTWNAPAKRRRDLREIGHAISGEALAAGKAARRSGAQAMPQRKPVGFDPNARNRRLASWFAPHVRRELELIAMHLDDLRERDPELADVLTACLSAILYKVSSRTSDTDGTWVDRNIARGAAARLFAQRVDLLEAGLHDLTRVAGGSTEVLEHDVRRLAGVVPDGSVAGILTSPPYAGTYDYAEHQRLRFDFLGLRHRALDAGEIGSRRSFRTSQEGERQWRAALVDAIDEIARVLAPNALVAIMIGDSFAGGRAMYALDDLRLALTDDLVVAAWASQERPMLGASEKRAFGDRAKAEHVMMLRRR